MKTDKYKVVGFGGNCFITTNGPLSDNKQYNFFHFESVDGARQYIKDVLEPLDRERAEGPQVIVGDNFD